MKKKVCKKCKIFVEGSECSVCKGTQFTMSWQGRLFILNNEKSLIAKKIQTPVAGEYAIKIR
ncbi:DNA-directed RNA polymerase subunit E'' [Candidatus Woesearchaeota archaeon]|mgnify:CR=1 FL=1|nr:DNA-directed RNA polymerase subunit E'' [Candidatus Woesearchaeota archaeon]